MKVPFVDMGRLHSPLRAELLAAFARVLDSGGFVQGREVAAFEAEFARQLGDGQAPEGDAPLYALAVQSGTAALHLALQGLGIGAGHTVITVANTFIATAEAITLAGATPVFADIEADGLNIDPADAERRITPRTRAIIAVHLYGEVADMGRLAEICHRNRLILIEDACQAHGATLDGRAAGTIGSAGCLSFYPTKNLGTIGEGGMVLTSDARVARQVHSLRDHGQAARHEHVLPGYRLKANLENDYFLDRERQKTLTYTGIPGGANTQDIAITEGMGPIADRTKEHLGTSDRAVITARTLLLEAGRDVAEGRDPRGLDPATYRGVRAYDAVVKRDQDWRALEPQLIAKW